MLEIAIFARENNKKLALLLEDISQQNFTNCEVFLYMDKYITETQHTSTEDSVISTTTVIETPWTNVSEKRNLAIKNCKAKYLLMLDDDNRLYSAINGWKQFLDNLFEQHKKIEEIEWEKILVSPTIHWRQTHKIQSAGIDKFNYFLSKVQAMENISNDIDYRPIGLVGGNSLFGKIEIFRLAKFDTDIGFVREDLDYIASLSDKGVLILMLKTPIYHMERNKTFLEKSFIKDWNSFKRKIRNRNIFVSKHGTALDKILFFTFWYWFQILYYLVIMWIFKIIKK